MMATGSIFLLGSGGAEDVACEVQVLEYVVVLGCRSTKKTPARPVKMNEVCSGVRGARHVWLLSWISEYP